MDFNANVNRLRYFQMVCQCQNVTKAATELNISQPSVTMAIKELEEELGVRLFNRHKNRLLLTEDGTVVLNKVNGLLNEVDQFYKEIMDIGSKANRKVRLGIPPIMGTVLIPKIYSNFMLQHPEISLEMLECTSSDAISFLNNNIVDIVILLYNDDFPDNYGYKSFYTTEIHFCVRKQHPYAKKQKISCADLENFPLAILSSGSFHHTSIINMFLKEKITPNVVLRSLELNTITKLVENYDMGTFTYRDIFQDNEKIAVVPLKNAIPVTLCAVWNKSNYITKSMEKVIRFLASQKWL